MATDHPALDATVVCLHEPGDAQCLVGVIGEDRPHCVQCRYCGQMVPWEYYGEVDRHRYLAKMVQARPERGSVGQVLTQSKK